MEHQAGLDLIARDIEREADELRRAIPELRARADELAASFPRSSAIYLIGCGDSLDGATAARFAIDGLVDAPVEAFPAMTFGTSILEDAPANSLVVGISQSGKVSRVIESIRSSRERGHRTLVVTSSPTSPIAQEPADACWRLDLEKLGPVPGMTSHVLGAVAMLELGSSFSGDHDARAQLRSEIDLLPGLVEEAIAVSWPAARMHAESFDRPLPFLALGYGATMTAARFTVRRVLELAQIVSISQETEEYAHDEYSIVDDRFRVLLFAPDDAGLTRSREVAGYLRRLQVHLGVVGPRGVLDGAGDIEYPLPEAPRALAPLVSAVPGQVLSLEVARRVGGSLYGNGDPVHAADGERQIYESEIVTT